MERCVLCGGISNSCIVCGRIDKEGFVYAEEDAEPPLNEVLCSRCFNWGFDILERRKQPTR